MSSAASTDQLQPTGPLTDERSVRWHPAAISDRKLTELHKRLEKVRRLGDAFAHVRLSPQVERRLHRLLGEA